jgi:hypothetical protein
MVNILTRITLGLLALFAAVPVPPAHADGPVDGSRSAERSARVVRSDVWIEEWDPFAQRWVREQERLSGTVTSAVATSSEARSVPLREFGPFVVLDANTAAVMGATKADSPADFMRMLTAFPGLSELQFIDAPGTVNDIANLEVGRMIRAAGISTHVPANGSVRSGAVELFLAGKNRTMESGARFAVHAWRDERGRGPQDFAADDPVNLLYIAFYEDMGMSPADARAFYDMTNSVPNSGALWFGPEVMSRWTAQRKAQAGFPAATAVLAFDPDLISQPFAPLDDLTVMPTIRIARSPQEPFAEPEARLAFAGI